MVKKGQLDNLGLRQHALNLRVNDAAANNILFETVKDAAENSEVDKLFKIDLAAKYKIVDYIIEMLRSGDSLYTSRTLKKAKWLFSDKYSDVVNPEYLQENVFPFTSMKMKRKILKTTAAGVTNPERAACFFNYLIGEKMMNTAFTCFLYTSEEFKLDQLKNNKEPYFKDLQSKDILYIRFLIKESFILLDAFLSFLDNTSKATQLVKKFKNFYSISGEKYLDTLEKFVRIDPDFTTEQFDLTLSKNIMKKHKNRVLSKPMFYVNTVNTEVLVRNSSIDDGKVYISALLPKNVSTFWSNNQYNIYPKVFEIIPRDRIFLFLKDYFTDHYPNNEFDMHPEFYKQEYYRFMTSEEREEWALKHLRSEKQIIGVGCDYLWYRFINFDLAFIEIKKLINVTNNAVKRNDMAEVLIESAKNNCELVKLFKYYSKRHMKELRKYRDSFMTKVVSHHNVFDFDGDCWTEFYALLLGMDLYNKLDTDDNDIECNNDNYKTVALLYYVLREGEIPKELMLYLLDYFNVYNVGGYLTNINEEKRQQLHEYFFTFYMNQINEHKHKGHSNEVETRCRRYYDNVENSIVLFTKYEEEYSETEISNRRKIRQIKQDTSVRSLLRDLKEDKELVINKVHNVKRDLEISTKKINTFLKKIKIYFPDDVTKIYLEMFQQLILNRELDLGHHYRSKRDLVMAVRTGVNAMIQLGDENYKIVLMTKYNPLYTKQKRTDIDIQHVRVQRAICWYACTSRPPIPLSYMLMYIKGEYAKHCLHMFNTYLAILPLPKCQQFVHSVIDAPVSIQKHAIRLAFQCFHTDELHELMLSLWNETRNVSLRGVIYKAFFTKVVDTKKKEYYEVLKAFTLDLHENDDDDIFDITTSEENALCKDFLGDYIEMVWLTLSKFKKKEPHITRRKKAIICMCKNINLMREDFVNYFVHEHIITAIVGNKITNIGDLYREHWLLVAHYIIHFAVSGNALQKYVQTAQSIFRENIKNWDVMANGKQTYQQSSWILLKDLTTVNMEEKSGHFEDAMPIFEGVLQVMNKIDHADYDYYFLQREFDLALLVAKVMKKNRKHFKERQQIDAAMESVKDFGVEIGQLVSNYVKNGNYFTSFSSIYKEKVSIYYDYLLKLIDKEIDQKGWIWEKPIVNKGLAYLAAGLIEFDFAETYLLAIQFTPTKCDDSFEELYKYLVNKLRQSAHNKEVQLSLNKKLDKKKLHSWDG